MAAINKRIEQVIINENLSNEALGVILGVSEGSVRNMRKEGSVKHDHLVKIADHFGYDVNWLMKGEGNPKIITNTGKYRIQENLVAKFRDISDQEVVEYFFYKMPELQNNVTFKLFIENMEKDVELKLLRELSSKK